MFKTEFLRDQKYTATIQYNNISDLHAVIDDLIKFVGNYPVVAQQNSAPKVHESDHDDSETFREIDYKSEEHPQEIQNITPQLGSPREISPVSVNSDQTRRRRRTRRGDTTEFEKLLEQAGFKQESFRNYMNLSDEPIWKSLDSPVKILDCLRQKLNQISDGAIASNDSENRPAPPSEVITTYRLFCLFKNLNKVNNYLTTDADLKTFNSLFDPIIAQKTLASKKKTPSNATK